MIAKKLTYAEYKHISVEEQKEVMGHMQLALKVLRRSSRRDKQYPNFHNRHVKELAKARKEKENGV